MIDGASNYKFIIQLKSLGLNLKGNRIPPVRRLMLIAKSVLANKGF